VDDAFALHDRLAQMVLSGEDLACLVDEIAAALGVAVFVTSTDGREWEAAAVDADVRGSLASAELVDETGRIRVERLAEPIALGARQVRMMTVQAPGTTLGRVIAVANRPLGDDDVRALGRATTVVALWTTREQAVAAVEHKYRGDFLRDVLIGRAGSEQFVLERAADFGWDLARPLVVLSAQIDPQRPEEEPADQQLRRDWQDRFAAAWRHVTTTADAASPSADFSSEVVALLSAGGDVGSTVDEVVHRVAGDKGGGRRSFTVGVSRVASGVRDLPEAYGQAQRALEVGRRVSGHGSTTWFDRLGLHRLLALVSESAEMEAFARNVLGKLAADTEEAATLRHSLQVLLDTNFNVAEAARKQFFHYNTMRYRVGKLERLLGPLTTDPNLRLDSAVALKVLEMIR
jgi:purine catabolism regulator